MMILKSRRWALRLSAFVFAGAAACTALAQAPADLRKAPRVLMILSSAGDEGAKSRPGFELDEFAVAYFVFKANGLTVEVASPQGGAPHPDKFDPKKPLVASLQADAHAQALLRNTAAVESVQASYDAVFVVGGKGAMFDLATDAPTQRLLAASAQRGAVVAAICHGVAALAGVLGTDGKPLVAGRRVTGFSDAEERAFGKRWSSQFPFWIEKRLKEQGAQWTSALPLLPQVAVDGRLVTGQNPASSGLAAEAVVRLLGRTPVARQADTHEATMQLLADFLSGKTAEFTRALQSETKRYHVELIGFWGDLHAKNASSDAQRREALSLMLAVEPFVDHPRLQLGIAQTQAALGEPQLARTRLERVLERQPNFAEGRAALDKLKL